METIRNYLEAMFANMPSTPEVWRAKDELYQMMEDKYYELREQGKSDNDAVGTVISEFGNLDELALDLGISEEVKVMPQQDERHIVTLEEIKDYLRDGSKNALLTALGVFLCIFSITGPILVDVLGGVFDAFGAIIMFVCIAAAVALFVISGEIMKKWKFFHTTPCTIHMDNVKFIQNEESRGRSINSVCRVIGIVFCVICWIPTMAISLVSDAAEEIGALDMVTEFADNAAAAMLFIMVAIGVFLLVYSSKQEGKYARLLRLNGKGTVSAVYVKEREEYASPGAKTFMELYWPTVICLYLAWSFLTFDWWGTWIIWPVAAIVHAILNKSFRKK